MEISAVLMVTDSARSGRFAFSRTSELQSLLSCLAGSASQAQPDGDRVERWSLVMHSS